MIVYLGLLAGGLVTGTIGSLLGLGGGIFLIPFLVLVVGLPMHQAVATSIVAVIATSSAGAAVNVERRTVHIRLGILLETMTVLGAILGGLTANMLSGSTLSKIFAVLLLVVAAIMIARLRMAPRDPVRAETTTLPASYIDGASRTPVSYSVQRLPLTMLVSLAAGNISGLLGIGGGVFKVPAMHLISGVPMKAATATSNFMIGVTAAASSFIYLSYGHVNPAVTALAVLGVLMGSFAGTWLAQRLHARVVTWIFALILLAVSLQMLLRPA
jgi:hypothetical protein